PAGALCPGGAVRETAGRVRATHPARRFRRYKLAERAEGEVVQRGGRAGGRTEAVVDLAVPGHRVDPGLGLLGRLDPDVAVPVDAGTGRDELTDDHVLLQADERVAARLDRGVGEHPRRLLE